MQVIETPSRHYSIVVVGAGPSGANFARLIAKESSSVLLIDGSERRGDKVCAGLLSPDAQKTLARYDVNLPNEILASPQLFSVRTVDLSDRNPCIRRYSRNYINMDRAAFDRFLRSLVPDNVDTIKAECTAVWREGNGFLVDIRKNGTIITVTADYVVGADGAMSIVRKSLFPIKRLKKYAAIQQWFQADTENAYYSCIFDGETSESCSWIFFKDGTLVFGGAFEAGGCREAFEKQKEKLVLRGLVSKETFEHPLKTEACAVARPYFSSGVFLGKDGAFLLGEAAGMISPSSLEGISYALESGEVLAKAFSGAKNKRHLLHRYKIRAQKLRHKLRLKCLKRPFMYKKPLRTLILRLGIGALRNDPRQVSEREKNE